MKPEEITRSGRQHPLHPIIGEDRAAFAIDHPNAFVGCLDYGPEKAGGKPRRFARGHTGFGAVARVLIFEVVAHHRRT